MVTVRQIERLWHARQYDQLSRVLLETRLETSGRLVIELSRPLAIAAMAVIRLDELNQAQTPFCQQMIRAVLAAQDPDGGWGEAMTTALCIRALRCCNGSGPAIDRAMDYLASLQKTDGTWPKVPIRRMAGDPFVSAFVLYHLAADPQFRQTARVNDAVAWFESGRGLDIETTRLWQSIRTRLPAAAPVWS